MFPADASDAHLHENALVDDLTGASLLRTRIVDISEKRVSNADTRSDTRSATARPRTVPDAGQPARPSAKHASARRPGAILRAAERLVLAAAIEDAAAGDANEGDGSRSQPPVSDDTREARFRGSGVFDARFAENEKETDGETNLPATKRRSPTVDDRGLPEGDPDLDRANRGHPPRPRLAATKGSEARVRREARSPFADARDAEGGVRRAAAETFASETESLSGDRANADAETPETLARALARLRVAVDGAKAKARAARTRLGRNLRRGDDNADASDDSRLRAALRGVGVDLSRLAEASQFSTRVDARAAEARASIGTRRAHRAQCEVPGDTTLGDPTADARRARVSRRDARNDADSRDETRPAPSPETPVNALIKFNAQSRRTQPLRDFLVAHFDHPYPSDAQRERLARETGMSRAQVGNWFINARVRVWRPMIMRLGEQIEDEREARGAAEGASRKMKGDEGGRAKGQTNRTRARRREASSDETAANAA